MNSELLRCFYRNVFLAVLGCFLSTASIADEDLLQLRAEILSWADTCQGSVSKEDCDDGDSTLFNGLVCSTGQNPFACDAIKDSQTEDGRIWRSPRRTGTDDENSFSRDMSFGVMLYAIESRDIDRLKRWFRYVSSNGLLCPDATDRRCDLTLGIRQLYNLVARSMRLPFPFTGGTGGYLTDLGLITRAQVTPGGYELHLVAMHLYVRLKSGRWNGALQRSAETLARREPQNPFFAWLAGDNSERVKELLLVQAPRVKPDWLHQWSFERTDSEEAWKDSMGWEFIFMIDLLLDSSRRPAEQG